MRLTPSCSNSTISGANRYAACGHSGHAEFEPLTQFESGSFRVHAFAARQVIEHRFASSWPRSRAAFMARSSILRLLMAVVSFAGCVE